MRAFLALLVLPLGAAVCGCAHDYGVEKRDTPVHVWLTSAELGATGGTIDALIYVGSQKIVEGPVRFEKGTPTVALPTAYLRAGDVPVSVVLNDGAISTNDRVTVEGECWVQIRLQGRAASIRLSENEPDPRR